MSNRILTAYREAAPQRRWETHSYKSDSYFIPVMNDVINLAITTILLKQWYGYIVFFSMIPNKTDAHINSAVW